MVAGLDGGSGPSPYRGEDRRRVAAEPPSPFGPAYWIAAALLLTTWGVLAALPHAGRLAASDALDVDLLTRLLQSAAAVLATGIGTMAVAKWRLSGDAAALWIGMGMLVYGVVRLLFVPLVPEVVSSAGLAVVAGWLRPATQVIVIALLARGVMLVPVDTRVSVARLAALSVGAIAVLVGILQLVPDHVPSLLDGAGSDDSRTYASGNTLGLVPLAWTILAAAFTWQGVRRRRWLFAWHGLLLLALALGETVRVLAAPPVAVGLAARELLRMMGLLFALNGATREILHTYRDASTRLAHSEHTATTAAERIRLDQLLAEERAHEARSALAAIEGATRTLQHYRDRLPNETQQALSAAVTVEIRRLQRLVSVSEPVPAAEPFRPAEAVAPLLVTERTRGADVSADVSDDLLAYGSAATTQQVVQALLDNARRYAPGAPVTIRGEREHGYVVLRVEDFGPGVPPELREAVFRRGVRGPAGADVAGSGLGLYVASKLMRDQGGELWVDDGPGGGASFALSLRAASNGSGGGAVPPDRAGDVGDLAEVDRLPAMDRRD